MNEISIVEVPTIHNVTVNERLNQDAQKLLFPKKLAKANTFLKKAGISKDILNNSTTSKVSHTTDVAHISHLIKTTRLQRNLSVEDLAHLAGVEQNAIIGLETHANDISLQIILKIFQALDAELTFVVTLQK
jgi:DNA-binding XRE family transcriptional regulator